VVKDVYFLKLIYDQKGKTLSVWFDEPVKEVVCEEVGDGVILSKDKDDNVIGFEKLYVDLSQDKTTSSIPFEIAHA
jgi:hypothetical protein